MSLGDLELIKQLPIVGVFLVVVFRIQKENRDYMTKRDEEFTKALQLLTASVRMMSDRVYGLGLAFVALASESEAKHGAENARKIMEDTVRASTEGEHSIYGMRS
jgi:hypothetical protein